MGLRWRGSEPAGEGHAAASSRPVLQETEFRDLLTRASDSFCEISQVLTNTVAANTANSHRLSHVRPNVHELWQQLFNRREPPALRSSARTPGGLLPAAAMASATMASATRSGRSPGPHRP